MTTPLMLGLLLLATDTLIGAESLAPGTDLAAVAPTTFCNPLDLEYCLQAYVMEKGLFPAPAPPTHRAWREAADPAAVYFQGRYYLFASMSQRYWHSPDLVHWTDVVTEDIPLDYWEPNTWVVGDALYYGHHRGAIFKSTDPQHGRWTKVRDRLGDTDTEGGFTVDATGRVLHVGLRFPGKRGFYVRELDPERNLEDRGGPWPCLSDQGFELVPSATGTTHITTVGTFRHRPDAPPWLIGAAAGEGASILQHGGKYFLQYAHSTSSAFYGYRDYAFTADQPQGPWHFQRHNPVAYKPTGFCRGAGNSSVFQDAQGAFWRATTVDAERTWLWERRVALYPGGFDHDGEMFTDTYLGDLPHYGAGKNPTPSARRTLGDNLVGWMLLSYQKTATASSAMPGCEPGQAVDEQMTSWWSATNGSPAWLQVDLGSTCDVAALQVNFAEQDAVAADVKLELFHQYTVEHSLDGLHWETLLDKSTQRRDSPHDYTELARRVPARFFRLTIHHMPARGKAAVRDFRIFGNSREDLPQEVGEFHVERLATAPYDDRYAKVWWKPAQGAEGYVVRYGTAPDKLHLAVEVRDRTELPLQIPVWTKYLEKNPDAMNPFLGLTGGIDYYFAIDTFNARGITRGTQVYAAPAAAVGSP